LRTARRAADKRYCEPFLDQNHPDIFAVRSQRSAVPTIVARKRSLRGLRARALNVAELEATCFDDVTEALGCSRSEVSLSLTDGILRVSGALKPTSRTLGCWW